MTRAPLLPFGPALALASVVLASPGRSAPAEPPVDFSTQVLPLFTRACVACHGPEKASGSLQLQSGRLLSKGGITDPILIPGQASRSYLMQRLRGEGDEPRMPLKRAPLSTAELELVRRWIDEGARLPTEAPRAFTPPPGGIKRLTRVQYQNTVRDLFGAEVPLPQALEPDTLVSGSASVGASRMSLSEYGVERFGAAAWRVARAAIAAPAWRRRFLAGAAPGARFDEPAVRAFIRRFGQRAWRRPLEPDEFERYLALARAAGRRRGLLEEAVVAVTAALVQSPHLLYRTELGIPGPQEPGRRRLGDYEMASRLSYFLWNAPPDDALYAAAAAEGLSSPAGIEAQARRMLASPRVREAMAGFFLELFQLRRLDGIPESRAQYPQFSDTIAASMREETLRLVDEVAFDPTRDFREIFSAPFTYVNGELARLYGMPAPAGDGYARVPLPADGPRLGILGEASFLTIYAGPTTSSPTKRGKFIREALLCQGVAPPPPDVDAELPEDKGTKVQTTRQKLESHRRNTRCAGCHKAMDPLGVAFEHFDGIGAFRRDEAGLPIDPSGELDGTPFRDGRELGVLLSRSPKVGACIARSLFRNAVGHLESDGDEPLLDELARGLARDGYTFPALVLGVVRSEGFRLVAPVGDGAAATQGAAR